MLAVDQAAGLRALVDAGCPKTVPAQAGAASRVLAIASGKRGVGKTTVAVNLAIALAQAGQRTLLCDADTGLANVDVLMGLSPCRRLDQAVGHDLSLADLVTEGPAGVMVVPGASGAAGLADMSEGLRRRLASAARSVGGDCDTVLVDTAAGISRNVIDFLLQADEVVLVTTPEPTALGDAYALAKVASAERDGLPFRLVVNQAESAAEARAAATRLVRTAAEFLGLAIKWWGYLPRHDHVPRAIRRRVPLVLAYPDSPVARCFEQLARTISPCGAGEVV